MKPSKGVWFNVWICSGGSCYNSEDGSKKIIQICSTDAGSALQQAAMMEGVSSAYGAWPCAQDGNDEI